MAKGKLRREFAHGLEGLAEERVFELCDEIEGRLLDVCAELRRIKGLTEIDAIRNTLEELVTDLW